MKNCKWTANNAGIPDDWFIRDQVPMTKEEVRVITISKLRPEENSIVWDIGAGTGSLSIETALRVPKGQVYAIERNKAGVNLIKDNQQRFGLPNLTAIHGSAPQALEKLPAPDRVIIGGSGGSIEDILSYLELRLNNGGRIVINAITLDTLSKVMDYFRHNTTYNTEIIQVSINRVDKVKDLHMLHGQNPVFIITGEKVGS